MFANLFSGFLIPGVLGLALVGTQHAPANACGCDCCQMGNMDMAMPMAGDALANPIAAAADNYDGQKTCPVTGKDLGSMGKPVAVKVKGDTIYVCCQGCVAKVNANPDVYLAKVLKEKKGNAKP